MRRADSSVSTAAVVVPFDHCLQPAPACPLAEGLCMGPQGPLGYKAGREAL